MLKRFVTGAVLALAAGLCATAATAAVTHVVDFEDQVFNAGLFPDTFNTKSNQFTEQGLRFGGEQFYFMPAGNPSVTSPASFASTFMEEGLEPVVFGRPNGAAFDLLSLDLALGMFNLDALDSVTITGAGACAPACVTTISVGNGGFSHFDLTGFTGLTSVTVGMPVRNQAGSPADNGYLAFDNITFATRGTNVPEPGVWLLMIGGLLASGYMLRRARQLAAVEA